MQIQKRPFLGVLAAVALSLSLLGCSEASDAEPEEAITPTQVVLEEATPPSIPPDLTSDAPPDTTASANGTTVDMGVGTYCWTTLCVDKIGPITRDTLTVSSGDEVIVQVPADAPRLNEVSVEAFPAMNPQDVQSGETAWQPDFNHDGTQSYERDDDAVLIPVNLEPGTYVLVVGMFFETGDVQYGVVLEVQ